MIFYIILLESINRLAVVYPSYLGIHIEVASRNVGPWTSIINYSIGLNECSGPEMLKMPKCWKCWNAENAEMLKCWKDPEML